MITQHEHPARINKNRSDCYQETTNPQGHYPSVSDLTDLISVSSFPPFSAHSFLPSLPPAASFPVTLFLAAGSGELCIPVWGYWSACRAALSVHCLDRCTQSPHHLCLPSLVVSAPLNASGAPPLVYISVKSHLLCFEEPRHGEWCILPTPSKPGYRSGEIRIGGSGESSSRPELKVVSCGLGFGALCRNWKNGPALVPVLQWAKPPAAKPAFHSGAPGYSPEALTSDPTPC